ncbi:MAG: hypothetical protein ACFHU9_13805 [Fluviicola sp.]
MKEYPEIEQLASLRKQFNISIQVTDEFLCGKSWFPKVEFQLNGASYFLFVDDEFEDFKINNSDLHLCLVLRSLENYKDSEDFLVWCTELGLPPSDIHVREYHLELRNIYPAIEKQLGRIDSFISDHDFELNAGAAQVLRKADQGSQTRNRTPTH